jgi:hypothetical protein
MEPKYKKNQRIRIVSVEHTKKEEYLNETGTIVDSFFAGKWGQMQVDFLSHSVGDYYVYKIRLDKDNSVVMVVEEEIEALSS